MGHTGLFLFILVFFIHSLQYNEKNVNLVSGGEIRTQDLLP